FILGSSPNSGRGIPQLHMRFAVALAAAGSFALGAAAMHGLYAQAKPLAYVIAEIEVSNVDAYAKEFIPSAAKAIEDAGGKFIVRGGKTKSFMGAKVACPASISFSCIPPIIIELHLWREQIGLQCFTVPAVRGGADFPDGFR